MELRKRNREQTLLKCVITSVFVSVLLSACVVVNASEEEEEQNENQSSYDVSTEILIDKEINNIDDPVKTTNYAGYILGRVVDSLTMHSYKSFTPYNNNDVGRMYSVVDKDNRTLNLYGNNELWEGLFRDCAVKTSLTCVKRNVFEYLNRSIETDGDFPVTDSLIFTRNGNEIVENKYDRNLNNVSYHHDHGKSVNDSERFEERSFSSFHSLTNVLYDKGVKFIMTHDLVLQLPEMMFDGAQVRISPKGLEDDGGAMFKVEVDQKKDSGEGRIFFKKQKQKLLMAFFALMMVIKLIKVKLMFVLPVLLGVGTAKKLFLKLLLFLFPAFAHIFKFCAFYHAAHTKFHHHHHQIAHHHHHVPVPVPVHVDHSVHLDHGPPPSSHYGPSSWDSTGPEYISNRNEYLSPAQENELESWGLMSKGSFHVPAAALGSHPQSLAYNAYTQYLEDQRVSRSAHPVTEPSIFLPPKQQTPAKFDPNIISPPEPPPYLNNQQQFVQKHQPLQLLHQQSQKQQGNNFENGNVIQQQRVIQVVDPTAVAENKQIKLQQQQQQKYQQLLLEQQKYQQFLREQEQSLKLKALTPRPATEGTTVQVTYDPFYSPMLQKMDNVFVQLGFNEEACRERLVCSMYKTPSRFSPHSNLISAQLSREAHELQKPAVPNTASVRFHRYVQAARDGQDQKDCLKLYPACTVRTE